MVASLSSSCVAHSAPLSDTLASEYLKDSNTAPLVPIDPEQAHKSHGVHMTFPFERDPSLTQDKLRTRASFHFTLEPRVFLGFSHLLELTAV